MKLYVYCVLGAQRHSFGYTGAASEKEAIGHALKLFHAAHPAMPVSSVGAMEIRPEDIDKVQAGNSGMTADRIDVGLPQCDRPDLN